MGKAGTKSAKHAKPFAAEHEVARAIAAEPAAASPITKRRIVLASLCGAALLAALATLPARDGTTAWQVATAKPAPIIRTSHPAADAWAAMRPEDSHRRDLEEEEIRQVQIHEGRGRTEHHRRLVQEDVQRRRQDRAQAHLGDRLTIPSFRAGHHRELA